jgi:hypothetical protein
VVATAELAGFLDRDDVARLFDDTENVGVSAVVLADRAKRVVSDVETPLAEASTSRHRPQEP